MPAQSRFVTSLRLALGVLKTACAWMPAPRYGQRVGDAQQTILVRGLCEQLPPRRPDPGEEG
ncbi:MAG TPA: hypothetical protein VGM25_11430 [Caulobacteraceae bacterium]|jgi:hypothetical protein